MQIALAWVLKNPVISSPIIGTSKAHHLDDALAGLTISLTEDEVKALEAPYKPKPVLDHAAGVIVGSALVEVLESGQDAAAFLKALRA